MKNILSFTGAKKISKQEQKLVHGGATNFGCVDRILLCNTDSDCPCNGTCGQIINFNGREILVGETCVYN